MNHPTNTDLTEWNAGDSGEDFEEHTIFYVNGSVRVPPLMAQEITNLDKGQFRCIFTPEKPEDYFLFLVRSRTGRYYIAEVD